MTGTSRREEVQRMVEIPALATIQEGIAGLAKAANQNGTVDITSPILKTTWITVAKDQIHMENITKTKIRQAQEAIGNLVKGSGDIADRLKEQE
jgi:hypothetical protein